LAFCPQSAPIPKNNKHDHAQNRVKPTPVSSELRENDPLTLGHSFSRAVTAAEINTALAAEGFFSE
jgi:hypothetical protein